METNFFCLNLDTIDGNNNNNIILKYSSNLNATTGAFNSDEKKKREIEKEKTLYKTIS